MPKRASRMWRIIFPPCFTVLTFQHLLRSLLWLLMASLPLLPKAPRNSLIHSKISHKLLHAAPSTVTWTSSDCEGVGKRPQKSHKRAKKNCQTRANPDFWKFRVIWIVLQTMRWACVKKMSSIALMPILSAWIYLKLNRHYINWWFLYGAITMTATCFSKGLSSFYDWKIPV